MKICDILSQIDLGSMALPEFQRGYVWNRDQVKGMMQSLYKRYPIGSLLVWNTRTENADTRGEGQISPGYVKLILDGQQRITSLYGIIRGEAPKFFEGNLQTFTGLYFNLEDESFEFYIPLKMKGNPLWVSVTELMKKGVGEFMKEIVTKPEFQSNLTHYINRLTAVDGIKNIDLHIEDVTGEDKTIDVVVDIFNRVNSGGTKLSKGDLALAKICATWPDARDEMKKRLTKWQKAGYYFKLDWLLRCINTILTGEAMFAALKDVGVKEFKEGLQKAEKTIDKLINMIASRLGLDHDQVLGSVYSFPLMARYTHQQGGNLKDYRERDQLLYWYIHTFLWGRYASAVESVLNQDLHQIEDVNGGLERLINLLRQNRGDLRLRDIDFSGWSMGARFYPMLYMMTRVCHAKDWGTGNDLSSHLLGSFSRLHIHHIFPKSLLYAAGYQKAEVNALANFTFLTQETNQKISDQVPELYLEEIVKKQPGVLESHWIPMDRSLWKIEKYHDFLAARRELLAQSANQFLDSLVAGTVPDVAETPIPAQVMAPIPPNVVDEEEDRILRECNEWITAQGLPQGEFVYNLLAMEGIPEGIILDLVWPNGLQPHYSEPVAVLLNEGADVIEAASIAGFKCFTDIESFKKYVMKEILVLT
ncbi:MAG TPA: DUF262 domain-containing protein [Bacillota bacterium]|nr:DUF262 domain-containing protein [Bacillota bacterium]